MNQAERLARRRFAIISLARIGGAAFLTLGLLALGGKVALPQPGAAALVAVGLLGFVVVPRHLARKWKSPQS